MSDVSNRLAAIASPAETFAWTKLIDTAGDLAVNFAVAVLILAVTFWLAGWANSFVRAALGRVHPRRDAPDVTLQTFADSMARNLVLVVDLVAMLQHWAFAPPRSSPFWAPHRSPSGSPCRARSPMWPPE